MMGTSSLLRTLLEYKAWANRELFELMRNTQRPDLEVAWHPALRLLNHVHVVDQIFVANLQCRAHGYKALNTPQTPQLADLCARQSDVDAWFLDFAGSRSPQQLDEPIDFVFVDGKPGRMSGAEMLAHVITHGAYHRGAVGRIIGTSGVDPPREILTRHPHPDIRTSMLAQEAAARGTVSIR
jgi:uncharacterized damage-inducible protein DinB